MSSAKIQFSVLMSVYHKENPEFLKLAIESITSNQTIKPDEVVLIQDGPLTSELYKVIDHFKSELPYFKTYSMEKNSGLGKALEYGITKCTYVWIARMDSDDIAASTRFEEQLDFIKNNPKVDVFGTNIAEFDNDISETKSLKVMPEKHDDILKMSKRRNPLCHMTVMYKKSVVVAAGGYQDLPFVEDYYLWVRMINSGARFANLNKVLVYARIGNGMYTRRSNRKQIESWKVLNHFMFDNKMITRVEKMQNIVLIYTFVHIPEKLKKIMYRILLRS
ncbi:MULTISPECIES: glycosyltransferase [Streptococcus]|uniref:Glycosyltransferase n=1 Tax=Streptococcus caledonicus TaxID=2614158 RepID=A0ABW0UG09_9STRE|nr:glycosyltransferase [Streptococcus sp. S784/96/1]